MFVEGIFLEIGNYCDSSLCISSITFQKIIFGNNETKFKVDSFKKKCLLEGLDDIALSLKKSDKIENFEKNLKVKKPWIFND